MKKPKSSEEGVYTPLVTATRFLVTRAICIMSNKMDGNSLVCLHCSVPVCNCLVHVFPIANYDIAKLHYDGVGNGPYGYDARLEAAAS
jgi:hypothetical protein